MTALAEERHYRRGLVLGLTISELMLLLLFILLLLLSYLLQKEEDFKTDLSENVEQLNLTIVTLREKNNDLIIELEEIPRLKTKINDLEDSKDKIDDDFRELEKQLAVANDIIESTPELAEIEDLKEQAADAAVLKNDNERLQGELNDKVDELATLEQAAETAAEEAAKALVDEMYNSREDLIEGVLSDLQENGVNNASPDYKDGVLRLPQDVLFESGEGDLSQAGEENVDLLAEALAKWIPCYTPARAWACQEGGIRESSAKLSAVFIEGHTDDRPVVDPETKAKYGDNWGLSSARAISAFNRIIEHDPRLKDFKNEEGQALLSISGYADNRPAADKWTPGGREKNRRIDVRFIFAPNATSGQKEEVRGVSGVNDVLAPADK
ncbi:OmpA family protein [Gammaproteobacteria bacterium]|nr:OmpA family protein [Gammaproteobacteria bacterium]